MLGTLIVALPSAHEGGQLQVRHDGREVAVDFGGEASRGRIRFAAFFADCEHEVKPVTSGFRLCLAYNLVLKKGSAASLNLRIGERAAILQPHFEELRAAVPDDLTAIPDPILPVHEGLEVSFSGPIH